MFLPLAVSPFANVRPTVWESLQSLAFEGCKAADTVLVHNCLLVVHTVQCTSHFMKSRLLNLTVPYRITHRTRTLCDKRLRNIFIVDIRVELRILSLIEGGAVDRIQHPDGSLSSNRIPR